jgi:[ribosomal protein S5]-alanine N-acetyltransferase
VAADLISPTDLPVLASDRVVVRRLTAEDLDACCGLWRDIGYDDPELSEAEHRQRRKSWLDWTIAGYDEFARLIQPGFGERAVVARDDGRFLGLVGLVPALGPFGQLDEPPAEGVLHNRAEVGLFWAIRTAEQGRGYASEAAGLMIDYAFQVLNLGQIIATTERDNARSIGVMRKLKMELKDNPRPEPAWFQVVGVLERSQWLRAPSRG